MRTGTIGPIARPLLGFVLPAYALTWAIGGVIVYLDRQEALSASHVEWLHSAAALGPAVGAWLATRIFLGRKGSRDLLLRLRPGRVSGWTILLALSPLVFFGAGLLVFRAVTGDWYSFSAFASQNRSAGNGWLWLLPMLSFAVFEEIGWRGFLLPLLQLRYSAWTSTLILWAIWALWHLPFFFYRFEFSPFVGLGFFFGMLVGAVILTGISNAARGLLWPAMLFHFLNNVCSAFDKEILVAVLSTGFVLLAIGIFKRFGKEHLAPVERTRHFLRSP